MSENEKYYMNEFESYLLNAIEHVNLNISLLLALISIMVCTNIAIGIFVAVMLFKM